MGKSKVVNKCSQENEEEKLNAKKAIDECKKKKKEKKSTVDDDDDAKIFNKRVNTEQCNINNKDDQKVKKIKKVLDTVVVNTDDTKQDKKNDKLKRKRDTEVEIDEVKSKRSKTKITKEASVSEDDDDHKKKKKLMKKKKNKKKKKSKVVETEGSNINVVEQSLDYLRRWKTCRSEWSFQKVRQVWLLQNMYNTEKIPKKEFKILLEYLEGLKGAARQMTVEKSEKMLKDCDSSDEETEENKTEEKETKPSDTSGDKTKLTDEQFERIRQVIQLLS